MQTATIVAQYINEPKSPKGPASIKDETGRYWKFWPNGKNGIPVEKFQKGQTYNVGYKSEMYQGKEDRTITEVLLASTDNKPGLPPPKNYRQRTNPSDREDILLAVLIKERPIFKDPQAGPTEMLEEIEMLKGVCRRACAGQERDDQMNDHIQF